MRGCLDEGTPAYLSFNPSPKRKLDYTWHSVILGTTMVGINTHLPNKIVEEALRQKCLSPFAHYTTITREKALEPGVRIDFCLSTPLETCFLEVKNVHYAENKIALFPDCPTTRGVKHLKKLITCAKQGIRSAIIYVVQRDDCIGFNFCDRFDPEYANVAREALRAGVEMYAFSVQLTPSRVAFKNFLSFEKSRAQE